MFAFISNRIPGGASRLSGSKVLGLVVLLLAAAACTDDSPSQKGGGGQGGTAGVGGGGTGGDAGSGGTGGSGGTEDVEKVERIEVAPERPSIVEHETVAFHATAWDANDEEMSDVVVEWSSSDPQIATVDADGTVKGLRPGTVTIRASVGDVVGGADLTVTEGTIEDVSLESDSLTVAVDGTESVELKLLDGNGNELLGRSIPWVSADPSVATVDEAGLVTGLAPGSTSLSATIAGHTVEVEVEVVFRFADVAVGRDHLCGLTAGGGAWCMGYNDVGQLGTGQVDPDDAQTFPVRVGAELDLRFKMLALGSDSSCGLSLSGETWCWGDNDDLQLGPAADGLEFSATPLRLEGWEYVAISSMAYGVCGLDGEGLASCWGYNSSDYELGDPDNIDNSAEPLYVSAPAPGEDPLHFTVLRHGTYHSCGLTTSSRLYCWGYNSDGQIGDGTWDSVARPTEPLPGQVVKSFDLGSYHGCAVTADDTTWCWGENYSQQVTGDEEEAHPVPTERFDAATFVPVGFALGRDHSCAWNADGIAWCWGSNDEGQLGREGPDAGPAEVSGGLRFHKLAAQSDNVCGLAHDEKVYCWGDREIRFGYSGEPPYYDDRPILLQGQ